MAKLFIFGIGGTGSRVLRSLTMLLAAGVKFGADEIVPIIIDPDVANADLTRTIALFRNYSAIRQGLSFNDSTPNQFFKTSISQAIPNYTLPIQNTGGIPFDQFINLPTMSPQNQALAKMLFSDTNLNLAMNVGFKGNPNIGSVVLNQFANSPQFTAFANQFAAGDKIFIISSIFGGTGASGFPLLLKTLRTNKVVPNFAIINNAEIGALTVLPYFNLQQNNNSAIDPSTFISKTKSALAYYENNIINNGINAMYYLADDMLESYQNCDGGAKQRNAAHLIEFLGATAMVNFSNNSFPYPNNTANMEFGIQNCAGQNALIFDNFYTGLKNELYSPLVQFTLTSNALTYNLKYYKSPVFNANRLFKNFYSTPFFKSLQEFLVEYLGWLTELKTNKRSLDLFNLKCGDKPFDLVTGVSPRKLKKRWSNRFNNYDLVTDRLNRIAKKLSKGAKPSDSFLEMFYVGTQTLVSEKL